jgi:hypothetical protein
MSLPDATFAYQMIKRLHSMNTPHFHTIDEASAICLGFDACEGDGQISLRR